MVRYMEAMSTSRDSLYYGREWQYLQGTEDFTSQDFMDAVCDWDKEERAAFGRAVTNYRLIEEAQPGMCTVTAKIYSR